MCPVKYYYVRNHICIPAANHSSVIIMRLASYHSNYRTPGMKLNAVFWTEVEVKMWNFINP